MLPCQPVGIFMITKTMAASVVVKSTKKRLRCQRPRISSQNMQGLGSEAKLYELFDTIKRRLDFVMYVQETWREGEGKQTLKQDGMVAIMAADEKNKEGKGKHARGIGIILGSRTKEGLDNWIGPPCKRKRFIMILGIG